MNITFSQKRKLMVVSGFATESEKNKAIDAIEKLDLLIQYRNEFSLFVRPKGPAILHVVKSQLSIALGI